MPLSFLHPKYWLVWFGLFLLWLSVKLPWKVQMWLGAQLGKLIYFFAKERRQIAYINLSIAFPDLNTSELKNLNKKHFISLGKGVFDAALSWWGSSKKILKLSKIKGLDEFNKTYKDDKKRILLLGSHFSSLEIGGRIIAEYMPVHIVYRPHQNPVLEYISSKYRDKKYGKAIPKSRIRDMIKSIKAGQPSWFATDQNYQGKGSMMLPFFGENAHTNTATAKLATMTDAVVISVYSIRTDTGYELIIEPYVKDFPSGDEALDTNRLTQILEEQIKRYPDQYLWTHKRYKNSLEKFYENRLNEIEGHI